MKKIFYLFLLMINLTVFGQPTIYPLTGGFTFDNQKLDTYPVPFGTRATSCAFNFGNTYKYFSFKANFDMVFAFDLIATKPDFRFIVWKLPKGELPIAIFDKGGTITADRSVEGNTNIKGIKGGETDLCETFTTSSRNGYVKPFEGSELLKKDETVVIAVYGGNDTEPFDIKVNVAQERSITTFNNLCQGQSYTESQVYSAIQGDSGLNDIKLFTNNTFSTEIPIGTTFTTNTTIYAQVRDSSGALKYIYTIPLSFVPDHVFNFKTIIATEFACSTSYTILSEAELLSKLFDTVNSNYKISSVTINGVVYAPGDNITLAIGEQTDMKIRVHYDGSCPIDSPEKIISLKQGTPVLSTNIDDVTCDTNYKINFSLIFSKLGLSNSQYDLIVTLGGATISDGQISTITSTLTYKVKVKSKSGAACESNEVDFVVTKTSSANIVNTSINGICLADFVQKNVDDAIFTIQNGSNYNLKFYQSNGTTEILRTDLLNYIRTTKNGKIIVKALAADNANTICDTTVELTFNLGESTFVPVTNIPILKSTCIEVGAGYTFSKIAIENYIKAQLGSSVDEIQTIIDEALSDNQVKTIQFRVRKIGESCWSDEMNLTLQVITKPNVTNASMELQADCDDKITIDAQVLRNLFGAKSVVDYDYEILHNNSTPLTFAGGKASIKVFFKNKLDNTCFVEKEIIINEKLDLVVNVPALETYIQAHKIVYCEDNTAAAKTQIQAILDYIKTQYPTLVSKSSVDQILNQFTSADGSVNVIFEDPNYCGTVVIKFFYQKNGLPTITVPTKGEVCSGTLYILDFTKQTNYDKYNYIVEKDGITISGIDIFSLDIGVYKITIEDKLSGCSVVKTLEIVGSELPIIDKLTINQNNIIVSVKGKGTLEYALFDEYGTIIVDWQRNNTLNIPTTITNSNFTVKVRLNGCGITEETNIIYLDLPNVVTPNGDGKNDLWQPMSKKGQSIDTVNSYKLTIFDRFGKIILVQEGVDIIKWDGTLKGKPLADDTYWYLLEFSKEAGNRHVQYSGSILVKRKIN